jgi:hypothetical protein
MEFERSLFRIYERILNSENFYLWTKILSITFLTLSGITFIVLLFFNFTYINKGDILSKAISTQLLNNSTFYRSADFNLTLSLGEPIEYDYETVLLPEDIYNISIGSINYQFSIYYQVLSMPDAAKSWRNVTEHKIELEYTDIMPRYLWPLIIFYNEHDTILINQLGNVFSPWPGCVKNLGSKEIWIWRENDFQSLSQPSLGTRIKNFITSVFCFWIVSLITGLICRLAIAGSAGIMISLSWCMTLFRANENTRMILFFSFPWAGQPAYILRNAQKSIFSLVMSFFITLFVFYFMYACTYLLWTPMIFGNIYPYGLDERVYTMFSLIEFYSLLFLRTKKSVLWFPRIATMLICSLFIYRKNNFYPFMNTFFLAIVMGCFGVMVLVLSHIEKQVFSNDGPTYESPRLVYQPIFSRSTTALPEIWTTFYPVAGRGYFTEEQMSNIFPRQPPV